jgi:hypothetical protein
MTVFGDLPLLLQNFLSDYMEELISANQDKNLTKPVLSEILCPIVGDFGDVLKAFLNEMKTETQSGHAPFHLTIDPKGMLMRSSRNRSFYSDTSLFNFMWHLVKLPEFESTLQHALRLKFGNLSINEKNTENIMQELLQNLSTQVSLTCTFPVPPGDGPAHENSASFVIVGDHIAAVCDSGAFHAVLFQG